eukprot:comp52327_c0_seq1/m.47689 comp52327_c0_seq1/g.47689  ORF comp52327_c0_seq1/g.47689 comp52327_c0_seq1/m.47689 type:complete len:229 (-) comp52327_c0_seq1:243-929(-)
MTAADSPARTVEWTQGEQTPAASETILLTGFEPFQQHKINASWEAVRQLTGATIKATNGDKTTTYTLETRLLPVEYSPAKEIIPRLHSEITPRICIHVGVGHEGKICLERNAFNHGHVILDNKGTAPCEPEGQCFVGGPACLSTTIDVDGVAKRIRDTCGLNVVPSDDAGRYLCNYSYYISQTLTGNSIPVLFVHVPPLEKPYTVDQLTCALRLIIENIVNTLWSVGD